MGFIQEAAAYRVVEGCEDFVKQLQQIDQYAKGYVEKLQTASGLAKESVHGNASASPSGKKGKKQAQLANKETAQFGTSSKKLLAKKLKAAQAKLNRLSGLSEADRMSKLPFEVKYLHERATEALETMHSLNVETYNVVCGAFDLELRPGGDGDGMSMTWAGDARGSKTDANGKSLRLSASEDIFAPTVFDFAQFSFVQDSVRLRAVVPANLTQQDILDYHRKVVAFNRVSDADDVSGNNNGNGHETESALAGFITAAPRSLLDTVTLQFIREDERYRIKAILNSENDLNVEEREIENKKRTRALRLSLLSRPFQPIGDSPSKAIEDIGSTSLSASATISSGTAPAAARIEPVALEVDGEGKTASAAVGEIKDIEGDHRFRWWAPDDPYNANITWWHESLRKRFANSIPSPLDDEEDVEKIFARAVEADKVEKQQKALRVQSNMIKNYDTMRGVMPLTHRESQRSFFDARKTAAFAIDKDTGRAYFFCLDKSEMGGSGKQRLGHAQLFCAIPAVHSR